MLTRRGFIQGAAAAPMLSEMAYAQRALVAGSLPSDMVWLNANENPAGPPRASLEAMKGVLADSWRYHFQEFREIYAAVARSEDLEPRQVLVGAGSSEVLHAAVDAFTSPTQPFIAMHPTFEGPQEVARALGRRIVAVPLTAGYYADVRAMEAEARKAGGGLLYLCNPNNPTSAVTPKADIDWLARNLPPNSTLLIDEAYIHFGDSPELASAIRHVREGRDVIVTRTFSKIYGMAGLRVGFGCARGDLIARLAPFRNTVISIVSARAALAALAEAKTLVPERRAHTARVRRELCEWLAAKNVRYIEPQGNFIMIDVGRDVRAFTSGMPRLGVAVGRPFPPLDNLLRVTIGTESDMRKFREVFWKVYQA